MSLPLLQTKLYLPPARPNLVQRSHLIERLGAGGMRPFTLVSAPAGFGKTTLLSEWITQTDQAVAWLSLDDDDNDPIRFLTYLISALQTRQPTMGEMALNLLSASQAPAPKAILTLLLNELGTLSAPLTLVLTLVLDDYHVITSPAIHEALAFLIDHLPAVLRLVMTSRVDPPLPLARWRVRNQLTEIRADDLRFLPDEATNFLNEVMGLQLTSQQIATLERRTEGWVAGLQLAALSMQGHRDVQGFVSAFAGSNHYIMDYLLEEVLQQQPQATLDFLLQTSILDRFCDALCDAVTGRKDGQAMLEQLQRRNLFLIPLDDERRWYRYHHLFGDLLRQRLHMHGSREEMNALHQRTANWYRTHDLPDDALRHYLAATAANQAADLVEDVGYALIGQGNLFRLRNWLALLPPTLVRARPRLVLWQAWVLNLTGQPIALEQWLQEAELSLAGVPLPIAQDMQAQITTLHAYKTRRQGNIALAIAQLQQALVNCAPENILTRTAIHLNLGFNYWMTGQLDLADQAMQATQTDAKRIQAVHMLLLAKAIQANIALAQGKLRRATQLCQDAIDDGLAHNGGQPFASAGYAYAVLGNIWYEQNEVEKAEVTLTQAFALGELVADGTVVRRAIFALAPLKQRAGDSETSQNLWQRAFAADDTVEEPQVMLQQVRAWLVEANLTADCDALNKASHWAATYSQTQTVPHGYSDAYAQLLCAWIDLLQGQPTQTIQRLAPLLERAMAAGQTHLWIELLALQALAHAAAGDKRTAYAQLHQLLALTAPEGYIRTFVDLGEMMRLLILEYRRRGSPLGAALPALMQAYVDNLLAAFNQGAVEENIVELPTTFRTPYSPLRTLIEPLSERELEILRLVNAGLSNSEIADKILVTVGTVKKHLNNIFGKLAVSSRTQAIVRARAVKLIV